MSEPTYFIDRRYLDQIFGDQRVVRQFEEMQQQIATASEGSDAGVAATQTLEDATFITLSANAELPNERVLQLGTGLSFDLSDSDAVKIVPSVSTSGGWGAQFALTGETVLGLPTTGFVATRSGAETLENKTLDAPSLTGLGNYADDAAASVGGVPVGGVYRNGSAVQVRVS